MKKFGFVTYSIRNNLFKNKFSSLKSLFSEIRYTKDHEWLGIYKEQSSSEFGKHILLTYLINS